jgi:hypothetical protein
MNRLNNHISFLFIDDLRTGKMRDKDLYAGGFRRMGRPPSHGVWFYRRD